eukprot:m.699752 g.699752  ORF g.699752 m.699752 type:complete len:541 (+) comp22906_c0_seq16:406-2028(+)
MLQPRDVPFEHNGMRHYISYHSDNHTDCYCGNCNKRICKGDVSIGTSQQEYLFGIFFWYHPGCVTTRNLKAIWATYKCGQKGHLIPGGNVLELVPGYSALCNSDAESIRTLFSSFPKKRQQGNLFNRKSKHRRVSPKHRRGSPKPCSAIRSIRISCELAPMLEKAQPLTTKKGMTSTRQLFEDTVALKSNHADSHFQSTSSSPKFCNEQNVAPASRKISGTDSDRGSKHVVPTCTHKISNEKPCKDVACEVCNVTDNNASNFQSEKEYVRVHRHKSIKYRWLLRDGETSEETEEPNSETEDEFWDLQLDGVSQSPNQGKKLRQKETLWREQTAKQSKRCHLTKTSEKEQRKKPVTSPRKKCVRRKQRCGLESDRPKQHRRQGMQWNSTTQMFEKRSLSSITQNTKLRIKNSMASPEDASLSWYRRTKRKHSHVSIKYRELQRENETSEETEESDSETEDNFWDIELSAHSDTHHLKTIQKNFRSMMTSSTGAGSATHAEKQLHVPPKLKKSHLQGSYPPNSNASHRSLRSRSGRNCPSQA